MFKVLLNWSSKPDLAGWGTDAERPFQRWEMGG